MSQYVTKIRTESGDLQIDYNALANLPKSDDSLTQSGRFADAKATGDTIDAVQDRMQELVGNTPVSEQIAEQINLIKTDMLTIDITDIERGEANLINADTVGGILPSDFALGSELDAYKNDVSNSYLLKTETATNSEKLNGYTYNTLKSMMLDLAHPVGSYYWSSNNTNPSNLFGGTWEQIKDRFVLAAGSSYSVGDTGGAATVTPTVDQIPSHKHNLTVGSSNNTGDINTKQLAPGKAGDTIYDNVTTSIANTGGGKSHNNMPPYIVAYCWCRTA